MSLAETLPEAAPRPAPRRDRAPAAPAPLPAPAACAACSALPRPGAEGATAGEGVLLSLPDIHCAACIASAEAALTAVPGVEAARVNLTQRRARVTAPGVPAETLVEALARAGHVAMELDESLLAGVTDRAARDLLMRLGVAGFAMMNVMLLSVAVWSGAGAATRDLFHWISAAIALPALAVAARPFFVSALAALRGRRLNMDVPISLALLLAAGLSLSEVARHGEHAYFDAALSLTFFLLAGRYLDLRGRQAARSAAAELSALDVPRALRLGAGGAGQAVPASALGPGDVIRLRPGGRLPTDGVIRTGTTELDRALLTGETLPVAAGPGDRVAAGEVSLTGLLEVEVTAPAAQSTLARLTRMVAEAEGQRTRYTPLADRAAAIYAPAVHLLALAAFLGWSWATGDIRLALNIAVAVLIITCPCALGLAVPAVATAATGRLFRRGLLVKHPTALERLAEVDTVVFDKTGTLTGGQAAPEGLDDLPPDALALARALAAGSSHVLARALETALAARGVAPAPVEGLVEHPGRGVEARLDGRRVRLGRADWLGAPGADSTATWLDTGAGAPLAIRFTDPLRPGADRAVAALRALGLEVELLSGDAEAPVGAAARAAGIDRWQAALRPEDKLARLDALAARGRRVLMVGDGLNDAAALAAAHASISPAGAVEAARAASDMVLLNGALEGIAGAVATARRAVRRIKENFAIAALYNAVAVPVALAGLATPLAAALAMSASSISVSLNAARLRR